MKLHKLKILKSANQDFLELRAHARQYRSQEGYERFKQSFKDLFADIALFPLSGVVPQEASGLGLPVRMRITEQIRVIYEVRGDTIYIRLFIHTAQDFQSHLLDKILRDT